MPTTPATSPGTLASDPAVGTIAWANPSNAGASDDSYAVASLTANGTYSEYLKATNFGFAIPTDATINGILVEFERKAGPSYAVDDNIVRLVIGGTVSGSNLSAGAIWDTSEGYVSFGGASNLWGLTPTYSDINASNFGVVLSCYGYGGMEENIAEASVDHVRITVTYTEAAAAIPNKIVARSQAVMRAATF